MLTMTQDSTLTAMSRVEIGRGNSSGYITGSHYAKLDLYDFAGVSVTAGNLYVGIWNSANSVLNMYDNSSVSVTGILLIGDSNPSSGTIDWVEGVGVMNVNDNATVNVSSEVRVGNLCTGIGTLNISSTTGTAVLNAGAWFTMGSNGSTGTLNIGPGAQVTQSAGTMTLGDNVYRGRVGNGTVNMSGGTLNRTASTGLMAIGYIGGKGVWNHDGGTLLNNTAGVLISEGRFATRTGGSGELNLNGGVFEAAFVRAYSTSDSPADAIVGFNGGTLRALAGGNLLGSQEYSRTLQVNVKSGGAIIDSNGFDVGVSVGLMDGGGGGGLTKQGAGTLVLTQANTYTGATSVTAGGLAVTGTGSLATNSITMAAGTALSLGGAATVPGPLATLSMGAGSTLEMALSTPAGANAITTGTLNLAGATTLRVGALGNTLGAGSYTVINQGSKTGAGTFTAQSLVRGALAVATVNPTNVTVAISGTPTAMNLEWSGVGTVWDTVGATSWVDPGLAPQQFYELDNVTFSDTGLANPAVTVNGRVHAGTITETGTTSYTLGGGGEIIIGSSLTKSGTGTLTFDNAGGLSVGGNVAVSGGVLSMGSNSGDNTLPGNVSLTGGAQLGVQQYAALTIEGVISDDGVTGLYKGGTGSLVLANSANTYTGPTKIGGVLVVPTLANGGVASSIGASSAAASNLRIGGPATGVLHYTGPSTTINRGFGVDGSGMMLLDNDLTMTGGVNSGNFVFYKGGPGTLTLISSGANPMGSQLVVYEGKVVLDGPLNTVFNATTSHTYIADGTSATGEVVIRNNAQLSMATAGMDLYIGTNGGNGTLTMTDNAKVYVADHAAFGTYGGSATINMSGNALLDIGYGRIGGQYQGATPGVVNITLNDNARIATRSSWLNIGEQFYTTNVTLNQTASLSSFSHYDFGYGMETNCTVVLNNESSVTAGTAVRIGCYGQNATGTITMNGDSTMSVGTSLWVGVGGNATRYADGTLILNDQASVTVAAITAGEWSVIGDNYAEGKLIMNDTSTFTSSGPVAVGNYANSKGTLIMTGDSIMNAATWIGIGNVYNGHLGTGSGEAFLSGNAQMNALDHIEVAWGGTGTLNVGDGTPTDNAVARSAIAPLVLGWGTLGADSYARVNINAGGTLETPGIVTGTNDDPVTPEIEAPGPQSSVLSFNGGVLKTTAENADFMTNAGGALVFQANVQAGGAKIDTNGFNVGLTVALTEDAGSTGGGLTKLGAGTLTLGGGANTYSGDTVILAGTLSTTDDEMLANGADVWIAVDAMLDLSFLGTDTIGSLYLDGVSQVVGTWGATGSGADNINDVFFSGTGMVLVTALPSQVPGDANNDGKVNDADAKILAGNWGSTGVAWEDGDFNDDDKVDALDASIMAANWGFGVVTESTAVPEPGMLALLLGLALAGLSRRVRR